MDGSKCVVAKPVWYQTSLDESPRKRRRSTAEATITGPDVINKDIADINRELNNQSPTNSITNTCLRQPHTQQYTEQQYTSQCTNTNIQTHSNISTHTRYTPETRAYENTHAQTSTIQQHPHNAQTNFTIVTGGGSDKSYYINNTLSEFQTSAETWSRQQQNSSRHHPRDEYVGYYSQGLPYQKQFKEKRKEEQMDPVEAELKRMNGLLEKILKCVQNRNSIAQKPAILPISTLDQMDAFQNIDDNGYSDVVNYFQYIGGFHLKEAVNLCFKEGFADQLTRTFTWWGREEGQRPLYNARFIMAIYEAICRNRHFQRPTRAEFQTQMRDTLRVAKDRYRSRMRGPRARRVGAPRVNRDFWEEEEERGGEEDPEEVDDA
ncbi:DUF4806 domain-containing protein [Camponotus japonicus]